MSPVPAGPSTPLIGTWTLVSFRLQGSDEDLAYPFGDTPRGRLVYGADGGFCVQLMRPHRLPSASADPMTCSLGEMERYFKGYIAYFGTYRVHPGAGLVVHAVEGALYPNWEGLSLKRYYALSDGLLELKTPPVVWNGQDGVVATITWREFPPAGAGTAAS